MKPGSSDFVWAASDFAWCGIRGAADKTSQQMEKAGQYRRIDCGLLIVLTNTLSRSAAIPSYRAIVDALKQCDHFRTRVHGVTTAKQQSWATAPKWWRKMKKPPVGGFFAQSERWN